MQVELSAGNLIQNDVGGVVIRPSGLPHRLTGGIFHHAGLGAGFHGADDVVVGVQDGQPGGG